MFGLELSDVLMAFCEGKVLFLAATKKAKLLQDLSASLPEDFPQKLEVLTREKADADKANFAKIVEALKVSPRAPTYSPRSDLAQHPPVAHAEWNDQGPEQQYVALRVVEIPPLPAAAAACVPFRGAPDSTHRIPHVVQESKGGKKIGGIPKEKLAGKFAAAWGEAFKESGLEQVLCPRRIAIAGVGVGTTGYRLRGSEC